jgi:hypothetical protein
MFTVVQVGPSFYMQAIASWCYLSPFANGSGVVRYLLILTLLHYEYTLSVLYAFRQFSLGRIL